MSAIWAAIDFFNVSWIYPYTPSVVQHTHINAPHKSIICSDPRAQDSLFVAALVVLYHVPGLRNECHLGGHLLRLGIRTDSGNGRRGGRGETAVLPHRRNGPSTYLPFFVDDAIETTISK